ncbi:hypothetical protein, partial [Neisseria animaloris]|uniref:hypothetical protein n=1 Tax=Neisseria animaloris TaxID=326522 RepID=UPI001F41321A
VPNTITTKILPNAKSVIMNIRFQTPPKQRRTELYPPSPNNVNPTAEKSDRKTDRPLFYQEILFIVDLI